jgi:hypothetical protein
MDHVSVSRTCTARRQRTTRAGMLRCAAGTSSRRRAGRYGRGRTRADHGTSVPDQASVLLGEGGFQGLLFGALVQKFNAVNRGRGGTPFTRGEGIDAQTDPREHGHVRAVHGSPPSAHGGRVNTHRRPGANLSDEAEKVQHNRNLWWVSPVGSSRSVPPGGPTRRAIFRPPPPTPRPRSPLA